MPVRKSFIAIGAALFLGLVVAACGGNGGTPTAAPATAKFSSGTSAVAGNRIKASTRRDVTWNAYRAA